MTANLDTRLASFSSPALSIFRIVFGLLYMLHGSIKLFGWPLGTAVPTGTWPLWFAGLIEFVLGLLIVVGLFTRIAAFIASGEMAFAYFYQHWPPLKGGGSASFWPFDPAAGGNGGELADHVLLRVPADRHDGGRHVLGRRPPTPEGRDDTHGRPAPSIRATSLVAVVPLIVHEHSVFDRSRLKALGPESTHGLAASARCE